MQSKEGKLNKFLFGDVKCHRNRTLAEMMLAVVLFQGAVFALEFVGAVAVVISLRHVEAARSVLTGVRRALVSVDFASEKSHNGKQVK